MTALSPRLFVPGVGACVGVSGGVGGLISRFVATDICFALSLPFSRFQQDPCLPRVLQVRTLYECGKAQVIFTYPPPSYTVLQVSYLHILVTSVLGAVIVQLLAGSGPGCLHSV